VQHRSRILPWGAIGRERHRAARAKFSCRSSHWGRECGSMQPCARIDCLSEPRQSIGENSSLCGGCTCRDRVHLDGWARAVWRAPPWAQPLVSDALKRLQQHPPTSRRAQHRASDCNRADKHSFKGSQHAQSTEHLMSPAYVDVRFELRRGLQECADACVDINQTSFRFYDRCACRRARVCSQWVRLWLRLRR
jgi:hypothetical protein